VIIVETCHREYREVDMTDEAKTIINCVFEAKGRYGLNIIIGTLLGASRARLKEIGAVEYKTYGALKDKNEAEIRLMISDGYLYQTEDRYSVLKMGNIAPLKDENTHVMIRMYDEKEPDRKSRTRKARSTDSLTSAGYELFEKLRHLRLKIAREESNASIYYFQR